MTDPEEIVAGGRSVARRFYGLAIVALVGGLVAGLLVGLHYTPASTVLNRVGLPLTALRPLHTGATLTWIFFAGVAMAYRWLFQHLAARAAAGEAVGSVAEAVAGRARVHLALWLVTASVATGALLGGYSSGREYLEYPPVLSIPIVVGWLLYGWSFVAVTRLRLRGLPVFAWMWGTSVLLFLWTFAEAHAWLLDAISDRPVRDLAIQWKAAGSWVGSFNLLVYGSNAWIATRLSGSDSYARSDLAFALFLLGILNSFTNYGHHTYHLPQSVWVKGVAFAISMTEAVVLLRVVYDCSGIGRRWASRGRFPVVHALLVAQTAWTAVQLALAIVYSVPFLNTYVHGTLAVVAHSMGSLIGIDTLALLASGVWLFWEEGEPAGAAPRGVASVAAINLGLLGLWGALLVVGVGAGQRLVDAGVLPWVGAFPRWLGPALLIAGAGMTAGVVGLVGSLWPRRGEPG